AFILVALGAGCEERARPSVLRSERIPNDAVKQTASSDALPPILHSAEWEQPVALLPPVNTAGAEDSAFVTPDGATLYFFFTPDVRVPPEGQVLDDVTGIYETHFIDGAWSEPDRVWLQDSGKLSLDGCEFVLGDKMWFCSVRAGNAREIDIWTAEFRNGRWQKWQSAGANVNTDVGAGELHITADGQEMYFHADKIGGKGGTDIWVSQKDGEEWGAPKNVSVVNSPETDGWPFISEDGNELWFTRTYLGTPAVYRSRKTADGWSAPELIVSQFAGEPTLDRDGNLYFTHHYFRDGIMLEADIYVAKRRAKP
ncbi:hypothetical protein KKF59_02310, partial [Patescibacteria group bacterium]|nr:hypothetical protein [Patescibacteria group bacterium]